MLGFPIDRGAILIRQRSSLIAKLVGGDLVSAASKKVDASLICGFVAAREFANTLLDN